MNHINYKKIFYLLVLQTIFIHFNCKLISKTITQTLYQTKIPPFGNVEFTGSVDLEQKIFSLTGAPTKTKFDLGILQIQNPSIAISNTHGLTMQAAVSIFNKTGTLAIEEFVPKGTNKRTLFSITPESPVTLSIPWKETALELSKLSLLVTPNAKEVTAITSLFGQQNILISFGIEKTTNTQPTVDESTEPQPTRNNYAKIFFKELSPSIFSKQTSNLDFVNFTDITIKIVNPFKKGVSHPITMSGITNIKLPGKLGDISTEFTSEYKEKKFEIFIKTKKTINVANGKIKLENTGIKFTTNGELTISGDAEILGTNITGFLTFTKLTPEEKTQNNIIKVGNYKVEFLGKTTSDKPIKPFVSFSGLPDKIKNIEIKNPIIELRADKQFYLSGNIKVLGFESTAEITVHAQNKASLKIQPTTNWIQENLLNKKAFSQLNLSDTYIIISSYPYRNEKLNQTIKRGFNIISGVKIQEDTTLKNLLGKTGDGLLLSGSFGTSLTDISLAIAIPVNVKLSDNVSLQNISLVIAGIGEIAIKSQIKLKKPNLLFTGSFGIDPVKASVDGSGTMQGTWKNPMGIKGVSISDTAVEIAISVTPPAPVPTKIGITGKLNIGDVQGEAAVKLDVTGQGGIIASINKLTLKDLLTIPAKLTPGVDWNKLQNKVPEIIIKNVDIKAAVVPFKIGEISFEAGTKLKGEINILNKFKSLIDCSVGKNGIIAKGTASEITIGKILTITGAGLDGIYGNEDDGPTVDLELTTKNQHLMISGMGKFMGIKGKTEVNIGKEGINFITMYDIFGSGMTLKGKSSGNINNIESLDFEIYGQFKNELTEHIANQIKEKLGSVAGKIIKLYGTAVMPLKISKVQVWTTFKELRSGELPRTRIDTTIFGKTFTIDEQLDLKNPDKIILHLTELIKTKMLNFLTSLKDFAKEFKKLVKEKKNVIFHNDTKYKIKLKIKKHVLGFEKRYDDIIIKANNSLKKWMQKNLRNMELYIKKDGKWKHVHSWKGKSNIVNTYVYKVIQINFGYFPNQTKSKFRRRIRENTKIIKNWN